MLDVHVLMNPHIPDTWFEQCLSSILSAEQHSPFPITLSLHDPIVGHIGRARQRAYQYAEQPYVAFVDPDDWITQDAFVRIAESISEGVPAARTAGKIVKPDGSLQSHHVGLFVCRKEITSMVDWESRSTACSHEHLCGTCELQRVAKPIPVEGHCYYRRYGYGSWASKMREGQINALG